MASDYVNITASASVHVILIHDWRNHSGNALASNGSFQEFVILSGETTSLSHLPIPKIEPRIATLPVPAAAQ
jgi:hypothetical protein